MTHADKDETIIYYVESQRGFCIDLYRALASKEKGNILLSPYSLSRVLFMLHVGARETSASQIEKCLKTGDCIDYHVKNTLLHTMLTDRAGASNAGYTLRISNALFVENQYKIAKRYTDLIKSFYGGGFNSVDFRNKSTNVCALINKWVYDSTEGMINNIFSQIDSKVVLIIVNAIYFKGTWKSLFLASNTKPHMFRTSGGTVKCVDMMFMSANFKYYKESICGVLQIPYAHGASMYIILPDADDIEAVQGILSVDKLSKWTQMLSNASASEVNLWLPKFKLDYAFSLKEVMITLGISDLFDPAKANLSGISDNIYVTGGVQKVVVEVNEEGTVAAAATGITCSLLAYCPPVEFKVDHPFLFMIRDDATGVDLFWGRISEL